MRPPIKGERADFAHPVYTKRIQKRKKTAYGRYTENIQGMFWRSVQCSSYIFLSFLMCFFDFLLFAFVFSICLLFSFACPGLSVVFSTFCFAICQFSIRFLCFHKFLLIFYAFSIRSPALTMVRVGFLLLFFCSSLVFFLFLPMCSSRRCSKNSRFRISILNQCSPEALFPPPGIRKLYGTACSRPPAHFSKS